MGKKDGYCLTCIYFAIYSNLKVNEEASGECRRYPPQIFQAFHENQIIASNEFPMVKSNDFCGEYVKKENHIKALQ